jgi:hypothetical protein
MKVVYLPVYQKPGRAEYDRDIPLNGEEEA